MQLIFLLCWDSPAQCLKIPIDVICLPLILHNLNSFHPDNPLWKKPNKQDSYQSIGCINSLEGSSVEYFRATCHNNIIFLQPNILRCILLVSVFGRSSDSNACYSFVWCNNNCQIYFYCLHEESYSSSGWLLEIIHQLVDLWFLNASRHVLYEQFYLKWANVVTKGGLFYFTSHIAATLIIFFGLVSTPQVFNTMNPAQLDKYPNYNIFYLYNNFYSPVSVTLILVSFLYKNTKLRQLVWREFKEITSHKINFLTND